MYLRREIFKARVEIFHYCRLFPDALEAELVHSDASSMLFFWYCERPNLPHIFCHAG
jgi:hypothetical protein